MSENKSGFKIAESERQSWISLAAVWTGSMICVPCLMIGGVLSLGYSMADIILCTIIGYGIICLYMCLMGIQGCDTGLPTVSMASDALGSVGSRYLISLILAVSCIGWFGIQASVCGSSFSNMIAGMTGVVVPDAVCGIFWGVIMVLTAMYGYNALKYLNYIAVPALILVLGYALYAAVFRDNGLAQISSYRPEQPGSIVSGISLVVATFAVGGVISGDYSRYAKNRADVVKSNVLGVLPSGFLMLFIGSACSIVTGQYDISSILTSLGLPAFGLVALVLATWTTNVTNAYSGSLAMSNLLGFDESKFKITTGVVGLIGTILGAAGIMNSFTSFLSILTSFIPPLAGVVIASYWIVGKGKPENFRERPGVNVAGIISFVIGAGTAFLTGNVIPFFVSPVNGIVISMVLYVALSKLAPEAAMESNIRK